MANSVFQLHAPIQNYDWGSKELIPEFFGWPLSQSPIAEIWYGAHELAPARAQITVDQNLRLGDLLALNPNDFLGEHVVSEFGPRLPYLMKALSAERPLSLQVHPKPHIARQGFRAENQAGVPLTSAIRNYKDDQHKPEMILALTHFEGLCSFRNAREMLRIFKVLKGPIFDPVRSLLENQPNAIGIQEAFTYLLAQRETADLKTNLVDAVAQIQAALELSLGPRVQASYATALFVAEHYPNDPGILVSLMLNKIVLEPGQALFLGSGQVHAYLRGFGVEIMANSDNVLRAGLTSKTVDVPELLKCAEFSPAIPHTPEIVKLGEGVIDLRPPVSEFGLIYGQVTGASLLERVGPRILLGLSGQLEILSEAQHLPDVVASLAPGQAFFVPDSFGALTLKGQGSFVLSYVP